MMVIDTMELGPRLSNYAKSSRNGRSVGCQFLDLLPIASILHLACHGQQDLHITLKSGFELRDGRLTMAALMCLDLSEACFAFLGASETAKGDADQPGQGVNLAGTMLFVGFPIVIGTMW